VAAKGLETLKDFIDFGEVRRGAFRLIFEIMTLKSFL
jgi:hypothetical protein